MLATTGTTTPATATTTTAAGAEVEVNGATRTTITSDPGILCFHHCNVKVFCFTLPHICPNCKSQLDNSTASAASTDHAPCPGGEMMSKVRLLPFRLPYPFVRASQHPCAIVLRPTTGDFLNDYNNSTDLHIAVTTARGCIVEFDRNGLRRHRAADQMPEWWQCLLVGDVPEHWHDYWDEVLLQICAQPGRWNVAHYQEETHNCYTFVLAFLEALGHDRLSAAARSKTAFCEKFIVPRTTTAGKYISLYRKLCASRIYVHPLPSVAPASVAAVTSAANAVTAPSIIGRSTSTLCTIEE